MNLHSLSKIITISIILLAFACKKKEDPTPVADDKPATSNPCFNEYYNGTYVGSGFTLAGPYTSGTLTINKVNCQTVTISLYTNTGSNTNTQATQITLNGSSYEGKLSSNNNKITLTGSGNHMSVNAINTFTFNGNK